MALSGWFRWYSVDVAPEEIRHGRVRLQADGGGEISHRLLVFPLAEPDHAPLVVHPGVSGASPAARLRSAMASANLPSWARQSPRSLQASAFLGSQFMAWA